MTWTEKDLQKYRHGDWITITGNIHIRLYFGLTWTARYRETTKYFLDGFSDKQMINYLNSVNAEARE